MRFSFLTQQSVGNSSSMGTKYWMHPFQWHSRKIIMNRDRTRKNRRTTSRLAFETYGDEATGKPYSSKMYGVITITLRLRWVLVG